MNWGFLMAQSFLSCLLEVFGKTECQTFMCCFLYISERNDLATIPTSVPASLISFCSELSNPWTGLDNAACPREGVSTAAPHPGCCPVCLLALSCRCQQWSPDTTWTHRPFPRWLFEAWGWDVEGSSPGWVAQF